MTEQRVQGNAHVDGLAFVLDDVGPRLDFPHAQLQQLRGEAGQLAYGASDVVMEQLSGQLRGLAWSMESASAGKLWLRDRDGRIEMTIDRVELPHGLRITKSAGGGVELVAPHASLVDVKLSIPDLDRLRPPPSDPPPPPPPPPTGLRQERVRFLDALTGELALRIAIVLDLPVIGHRTLNQTVKVTLHEGAFDFKKLDDGLTWLEGAFLDIGVENGRFRVGWGVPLFGTKEIISWALDRDAAAMAAFDRIPIRSLLDFRMPGGGAAGKNGDKASRLKSLTLGDIDIHLSLVAPRNVDLAGGTLRFGGDDEPGIVDLKINGALAAHPPAPGAIQAAAGALDLTVKDLRLGGVQVTADRVTLGPVDTLVVTFDGFRPRSLVAVLHRLTATNLSLTLGGERVS